MLYRSSVRSRSGAAAVAGGGWDEMARRRESREGEKARIASLCVFCGSHEGRDPAYRKAAARLGREAARRRVTVVYGGGSIGLMGIVARAALEEGGHVVGIIPELLDRLEVGLKEVSEFVLVPDMHSRKAEMFRRADAFVVLPGGLGTLDEFVEITTWAQLGLHSKPILLVNLADFFAPLVAYLRHASAEGFIAPRHLELFTIVPDVDALWAALAADGA